MNMNATLRMVFGIRTKTMPYHVDGSAEPFESSRISEGNDLHPESVCV